MSNQDIKEIYGKSIWDMTIDEICANHLEEDWCKLVDAEAQCDEYDEN